MSETDMVRTNRGGGLVRMLLIAWVVVAIARVVAASW